MQDIDDMDFSVHLHLHCMNFQVLMHQHELLLLCQPRKLKIGHGNMEKRFSPYQVRVQARRIHFRADNTPYILGVWLTVTWLPWSWGVSVAAHSL